MFVEGPTQISAVDAIVGELLRSVKNVLGPAFVGMYLEGSLASGDFDQESDIDLLVVTSDEVSPELFLALEAMHERVAAIDSPWAVQVEVSYLSRLALRRHDPNQARHPNLQRGRGERLQWVEHDETWNIHRYIVRERGITLEGPDPKALIDPISPDDLRRAASRALHGWEARLTEDPGVLATRGYQSYVVLTACRARYSLQFGELVSKHRAAAWAKEAVPERWKDLIDRALVSRDDPGSASDPGEVRETREFVRYTLEGE